MDEPEYVEIDLPENATTLRKLWEVRNHFVFEAEAAKSSEERKWLINQAKFMHEQLRLQDATQLYWHPKTNI